MNYFSGLKIKIKQRDSEEKDTFTLEDLMKIFYPDEYLKYTVDDPVRTQTHRNPVGLRFYRIPGLRNGFFSNRPTKQC